MESILQIGERKVLAINQDNKIWVDFDSIKDILEEYNNEILSIQTHPADWNLSNES